MPFHAVVDHLKRSLRVSATLAGGGAAGSGPRYGLPSHRAAAGAAAATGALPLSPPPPPVDFLPLRDPVTDRLTLSCHVPAATPTPGHAGAAGDGAAGDGHAGAAGDDAAAGHDAAAGDEYHCRDQEWATPALWPGAAALAL